MERPYETPEMTALGDVAQLTGIEGDPNAQDFVFNSSGVQILGPLQGSIDADPCAVSTDPQCGEGV